VGAKDRKAEVWRHFTLLEHEIAPVICQ